MSVGIHQATQDYISATIKHQNNYFTTVDYKYLPDRPPPLTTLDLINDTILTLRGIVLNITEHKKIFGPINIKDFTTLIIVPGIPNDMGI